MSYSSGHKIFADCLNILHNIKKQDVLDNPENYLGPNYKEVFNWWYYWDSWSDEKRDVYLKRCRTLSFETRNRANKISKELSMEVISPNFVNNFCILEKELISAHLYIERDIPFTFLPLIFDL